MMQRRAEMGVGTLIIFIALLLVAAVAAGVLIQTAGSLQQRALSTGAQATGQISTNALALEVSATDGTDSGGVENFSMIMKLAPGSEAIKLDDVTLTHNTVSETVTYQHRADAAPADDSNYCGANTTADGCKQVAAADGNFTVDYLQQGANHQPGVLVRGDVIRLYFQVPSQVGEGADIRLNFIPKIGSATRVLFSTPDVMSTERVYLYP